MSNDRKPGDYTPDDAELELYESMKAFLNADLTEKEASFEDELGAEDTVPDSILGLDFSAILKNKYCYQGFKDTLEKNAELLDNAGMSFLIAGAQ